MCQVVSSPVRFFAASAVSGSSMRAAGDKRKMCTVSESDVTHSSVEAALKVRLWIRALYEPRRNWYCRRPTGTENTRTTVPFSLAVASSVPLAFSAMHARLERWACTTPAMLSVSRSYRTTWLLGPGASVRGPGAAYARKHDSDDGASAQRLCGWSIVCSSFILLMSYTYSASGNTTTRRRRFRRTAWIGAGNTSSQMVDCRLVFRICRRRRSAPAASTTGTTAIRLVQKSISTIAVGTVAGVSVVTYPWHTLIGTARSLL